MYRLDSFHSLLDNQSIQRIHKYKMKTVLCLVSGVICCLVTLSLTAANPVTEGSIVSNSSLATSTSSSSSSSSLPSSTEETSTDTLSSTSEDSNLHLNGGRLIVTNVVKTLQFDVVLADDDDDDNSTSTDVTPTQLMETNIEVLNPQLLDEVASALHSDGNTTNGPIDGTKDESLEDQEDQ